VLANSVQEADKYEGFKVIATQDIMRRDVRFEDAPITKAPRLDLMNNCSKSRRALLERSGLVHMLVPEVLDRWSQMTKEDYICDILGRKLCTMIWETITYRRSPRRLPPQSRY
jgi:hypothetical protein